MPNEIGIDIDVTGADDLKKLGAQGKKAGEDIGDGLKKGFKEGQEAGEKSAAGLKGVFGEVFGSIGDMAGEAGGQAGDLLANGISAGKAGLLSAGVAAGAFIIEGMQMEMEEDKVGGLLAAQTGAASSAAEGLGNTAGAVFADNFGESIEEVGDAMASVFENKLINTDAPEAAIKDITEDVMTLSKVMGESFDDIGQAASRMVRNDIGESVSEAMDLIGHAQEKGLNASGDLLDTLEEYSVKFHDLGLNGQQALGLIEQAMDGGARNTDVAADALKEFQLQASELGGTAARGFETLGFNAQTMSERVAAGGDSARQALGEVLDRLREMPPGTERATAAVDLFGTKAEDLGQALFDMDLDTAADKFGKFGGTVEEMAKKIDESTSFWDKLGKGISNAAASVGEFLDQDFSEMLDNMPELKSMLDEINQAQKDFDTTGNTKSLEELARKYPEAADKIHDYINSKKEEKEATDGTNDAAANYVETLDKLISKQQEAASGVVDLSEANIGYQEAIDNANKVIGENGKNLDLSSESGRENQGVLNDLSDKTWTLISAMEQQGATVDEVRGFMGTARDQFVQTAMSMGYSRDQANDLANKLRLIPGEYNPSVRVTGLDDATNKIRSFGALLNAVLNRSYSVAANVFFSTAAAFGKETGGNVGVPMWGAATGGQRHSSTLMNEGGPEVAELPNGSRVATAGATRALAEMGAFSGGGGPTQVVLSMENSDPLIKAILGAMRVEIKNSYGGSAISALSQRGVDR